ncbi:MAG: DUF3019 domain-containing protein [Kangiellaceae bacterium]|nr:DUF3019 domain-containing protein [Kangiellaceae bacterium]
MSPQSCFVFSESEQCERPVEIHWKAEIEGNYCLFISGQLDALKCWFKTKQGSLHYLLATSEDINFELRQNSKEIVIFSNNFKLYKQIKKRKKKRRNPWSFY